MEHFSEMTTTKRILYLHIHIYTIHVYINMYYMYMYYICIYIYMYVYILYVLHVAVLLKSNTLDSLENYTRSVYWFIAMLTLCLDTPYFRLQFIKVHCTVNNKNAIKLSLNKGATGCKVAERFEFSKNKIS